MNKQIKIIIAIGIIGIVLLVAGFVMGSRLSSLPAIFSEAALPEGAVDIESVSSEDVQSVVLNLTDSDISIKTGETFNFSGSGLYDSYVLNGTFYVGAADIKHSTKTLGSALSIPSKYVCGYGSYVLVIPPDAITNRQIEINTTRCDITCDSLIAGQLTVNMKGGNLSIDSLSADTASIDVSSGKIDIGSAQIAGSGTISAKKSITIGNGDVISTNLLNNTTVTNKKGDISFYGKVTGSSSFVAKHQDINAFLSGTSSNYSLTGLTERATITSATVESADTETGIYGTLDLEPISGNAYITFQP
jgi:hypothetical protein